MIAVIDWWGKNTDFNLQNSETRNIKSEYLVNYVVNWQEIKIGITHCLLMCYAYCGVVNTGFEPVTSALSRRRSKPTELIDQN